MDESSFEMRERRQFQVDIPNGEFEVVHASAVEFKGGAAAFYDVSDPVRTDGLTDEQWFAIEGQEDSFLVRAYGPGTWDRVHETPID